MGNTNYLVEEKTGKLMFKYAIPCVISLLVGALYNIVDQIFIANATYLGSFGNAANTVVFPLTVIALAIAVMIGDGCCAYVSIRLGKNEKETAATSVAHAILVSVIAGFVLFSVYLIFKDELVGIFGGNVNSETYDYSKEYFFYITLGIPVYIFGQSMNPIIRADGSPRYAMASILAGAVLNIILDPIFIFICKWGMMGAAVATVIGQVATSVLTIVYLCRMNIVKINKASFHFNKEVLGRTLSLGLCSFLAQMSLVVAMAAINNMVKKYGTTDEVFGQEQYAQIPMAILGIVMKIFQIVISVVIGMAAGCIPIVGYNIGAKRYKRVKDLFYRLIVAEAVVGLIALIVIEVFPTALLSVFGSANESVYYTQFGIKAFRIYLCMIVFACVNKATFIFLQAMGKAVESTVLSMVREIVFGAGLALLLPLWMGLDGVLLSMPVSDFLTSIVSAVLIVRTVKQLNKSSSKMIQ